MVKSGDSNKAISEAIRYFEEGDLVQAFELASGVLAAAPNDADANFICARHLIETGDMERSQNHLEKAISARPSFTDAHHAVGVLNQMSGRYNAAMAAFTKALELDPSHLQANLSLALLYCNSGNLTEALVHVGKVLSVNTEVAAAHFVRGECLRNKDSQEAIRAYKRAIMVNPEFAEAWFNLGVVLFRINSFRGAVSALREAARLLPNATVIAPYLGASLLEIGQFEEGLEEVGISSGYLEFSTEIDAPVRAAQFGCGKIEFYPDGDANFAITDL